MFNAKRNPDLKFPDYACTALQMLYFTLMQCKNAWFLGRISMPACGANVLQSPTTLDIA
jgi:hypothetical protein